jgi:hypothetical protein
MNSRLSSKDTEKKKEIIKRLIEREPNLSQHIKQIVDDYSPFEIEMINDNSLNTIIDEAKAFYDDNNTENDKDRWLRVVNTTIGDSYVRYKPSSLREWFYKINTEDKAHYDYIWSNTTLNILRRIEEVTGQRIAVIMDQGEGKTALCHELQRYFQSKAVHIKLDGKNSIEKLLGPSYDVAEGHLFYNIIDERPPGIKYHSLPVKNVIIEFPDYSKHGRAHFSRDFGILERWLEGGDNLSWSKQFNLILVWQNELPFDDHFFMNKWERYYPESFNPSTLANHVIRLYPDQSLFTYDALIKTAYYAHGNLRSFKRYLRICLEESNNSILPITEDHVDEWISIDMRLTEWQRKLSYVFPIAKDSIEIAVDLLYQLGQKPMYQSTICEKYFDSNKPNTSKFLRSLEDRKIIKRVRHGNEKLVEVFNAYHGVDGFYR